MIPPICAVARLANGATLSIVLMPHASVTCRCQHNDPACVSYCVLGSLKILSVECGNVEIWNVPVAARWSVNSSQWNKSWGGSSAPPSSIPGKDRNRNSKDFLVHIQFSISLAMERDALQPHSIMTLFHGQKHRKLDFFLQSYFSFSQWNIELISCRLWTSTSPWKENNRRREWGRKNITKGNGN